MGGTSPISHCTFAGSNSAGTCMVSHSTVRSAWKVERSTITKIISLPMRQESLRIIEIEQIRGTRRDTQKCQSNHSTPKGNASMNERMRMRTSTTSNCSIYQLSGGSIHSPRRKMRSYKKTQESKVLPMAGQKVSRETRPPRTAFLEISNSRLRQTPKGRRRWGSATSPKH